MNHAVRFVVAGALAAGLAVAGAAQATVPSAGADAAGSVSAAVLHAKVHMGGILLPDNSSTFIEYTAPDKRVNVAKDIQFKSWFMRKLGALGGNSEDARVADIFRLDRHMVDRVFYNEKTYYECRMHECPTLFQILQDLSESGHENSDQQQAAWHPQGTEQCPLHRVHHDIAVTRTDQHKTINGFPVRLYKAKFTSVYADDEGRQDTNLLHIEMWTTPITPALQRIQALDREQTEKYVSEQKRPENPLARILPRRVFNLLETFVGDTNRKNYKWNTTVGRKLAQIDGYPIKNTVDWFVHAHACPGPQESAKIEKHGGFSVGNPLGSLKSMIGHKIGTEVSKQVKTHFLPGPDDPIVHWNRTITAIGTQKVDAALFEVPAGFVKKPMPSVDELWNRQGTADRDRSD
jgi:hypothetical protein